MFSLLLLIIRQKKIFFQQRFLRRQCGNSNFRQNVNFLLVFEKFFCNVDPTTLLLWVLYERIGLTGNSSTAEGTQYGVCIVRT